ncbi:carbohydrate kinase family protein [Streptomyces sp. WAC 00631]|uniref:carbohydrate kinase family protein n=1 Tax=Streptomyces sp. WAC 00631 TaxID=2203201 RepID=UPI0026BA3338|nr:carbohydrate kinase family protein [Streptomyces sp. WAC 00631]
MSQSVIALGAHVFDVLVRPVEAIPEGQGAALVDQIRFSPAGTAAGTALTLAKLGAMVRTAGAVGTDPIGDLLLGMLAAHGVDTSLVLRRDDTQASASVLPIRPDGSRPAFHVLGANLSYGPDDAPHTEIAGATHLHLVASELMGGEAAAKILAPARAAGVVTSADLLASGDSGLFDWIAPALPYLDHLLPNEARHTEQSVGHRGHRCSLGGEHRRHDPSGRRMRAPAHRSSPSRGLKRCSHGEPSFLALSRRCPMRHGRQGGEVSTKGREGEKAVCSASEAEMGALAAMPATGGGLAAYSEARNALVRGNAMPDAPAPVTSPGTSRSTSATIAPNILTTSSGSPTRTASTCSRC